MTRIALRIEVDLDALPGFGHSAQSWLDLMQSKNGPLPPWYNPTVALIREPHEYAPEMLDTGLDRCRVCLMDPLDQMHCELEPISDVGDQMSIAQFYETVMDGGFIDYDGFGHYATDTQQRKTVIKPSDVRAHLLKDGADPRATGFNRVVWFNR